MGVDKYIKLAPYLEVIGSKSVNDPLIRRFCSNHPQKNQGNSKFCSECGALVKTEDIPNTINYTPARYIQRILNNKFIDEFYFGDDESCLMSNKNIPNEFDVDEEISQVIPLSSSDTLIKINDQIAWFKATHAEAIEVFKKEFGDANVTVKWGLIHYWS